MAKRPDISVILVFNRQVVRADFSSRQLARHEFHPRFFVCESVDVESNLSEAVTQVVAGQPTLANRTIVLSSDVWSQVVALPRLSVHGIEPDELQDVLKFEAETLSGIDIDEISLSATPLGTKDDLQQYWVSAIRQSDLDDVHKLLTSMGCREIVIAHPAGMSGNAKSPAGESIEVWDELVFYLTNRGTQLARVKQASADEFTSSIPILYGGSSPEQLPTSCTAIRLDSDEAITQFTAEVATNYVQRLKDLAAPLIRLSKRSRAAPVRHLISGLIAMAVIGFCFWHWQDSSENNAALVREIELAKQPALAKKKYDSQLISILEQRAEVESNDTLLGDDLKRVRFFLDNQSNRIAKLLTLLVDIRTNDLVIETIGGTEDGVLISGISLNGESAQALAKRLRERAVPMGWAVNPARQDGQQKLTTGGPWNFEILLTDTGPFETAVQPRKKQNVTAKIKL